MTNNIVLEKAIAFALRIIKLYKFLSEEKKEYILSKQILISGTYVAKHAKEATQSDSRQSFAYEMQIAMKRASETEFWLLMLRESGFLGDKEFESINADCVELIKILTAIVKTAKQNA